MEEKLNRLFLYIRQIVLQLIYEKEINIDELAFDLGVKQEEFLNNFTQRNDDFTFYLDALSKVEHWEV